MPAAVVNSYHLSPSAHGTCESKRGNPELADRVEMPSTDLPMFPNTHAEEPVQELWAHSFQGRS